MSWRARSAPIDNRAASAAEKNAVAKKQRTRKNISKDVWDKYSGGSMDKSLLVQHFK